MSDVVLLRKLSRKSIMNFGKYFDLTVQQCIDTKKKQYLKWVYFNMSNITFMDEILDELKIPIEYRFDKPNKNSELGEKLKAINQETYPEWFKEKLKRKAKRLSLLKSEINEFKIEVQLSKINLMNQNRATKNKYK
jgi:hypothetical protein